MGRKPGRSSVRFNFLRGLAKSQCFRLSEDVGHENVVMPADGIQGLSKYDEVAGDEPGSLVDELIKRVLPVCAWLSPIDRPGLIFHMVPIQCYVLAVAFHRQLLQIGWEALQILLIGKNCNVLRAKKVVVIDCQHPQENGKIALKGSSPEMNIHLVKSAQHFAESFRADRNHRGEPNRRVHRVAPTHPVPELEHVGRIDAELLHPFGVS